MTEKDIRLGFDRFIAKSWADQAFALFCEPDNGTDRYAVLKEWLSVQIKGKEATRKTGNQLKRMWLNTNDDFQVLRTLAGSLELNRLNDEWNILHYGMAINVFPIFRDVCLFIGKLSRLQGECSSVDVKARVIERFGSPFSIPRIVDRVFQTLSDWQIIEQSNQKITTRNIDMQNKRLAHWFLCCLVFATPSRTIRLTDVPSSALNLGIMAKNPREIMEFGKCLSLQSDTLSHEVLITVSR